MVGEVPLVDLFGQREDSPCIPPDYIAQGVGKPTWMPKIKQVDSDGPVGINSRATNAVFPIDVATLQRKRIVTVPVRYDYTFDGNAHTQYQIKDTWNGEVKIALR